jgi:hypothetical protein
VNPLDFQLAGGTVIGREHRRKGINNHDAWRFEVQNHQIVAVVADGCGSGAHSEVGAKLGTAFLVRHLFEDPVPSVTDSVHDAMDQTARSFRDLVFDLAAGEDQRAVVVDYFLFTLVGALIRSDETCFFSCGDGVVAINGKIESWDYPDNAPPYLGYQLVPGIELPSEMLKWRMRAQMPTTDLNTFLLGTDGINDLMRSEGTNIPGKQEPVGPLEQLWEDGRFFQNPYAIGRHLALVGRDVPRTGEHGLLGDDTTVIVGRRSPEA